MMTPSSETMKARLDQRVRSRYPDWWREEKRRRREVCEAHSKRIVAIWEWAGTALQILGAAIVASRAAEPVVGYSVMLPGSVIWLGVAFHRSNWALALMQSAFAAINIIGILRWLG